LSSSSPHPAANALPANSAIAASRTGIRGLMYFAPPVGL
jgi:hypothetical protein